MALENRQFPHLLPDDIQVWKRFLAKFGHLYTHFDYDVRVGKGRFAPEGSHRVIKKMAIDLSKRRIDAVGWRDDKSTIIELTTGIGFTAIGQIQIYWRLYTDTFGLAHMPSQLLVGSRLEDDIAGPLKQLGIPWVTIDENNNVAQSGHLIL